MKVTLLLEETGIEYKAIPVDSRKGDQHKPEYKVISPSAKAPSRVDGDAPIFDSNAILIYLADKLANSRLLLETQHRAIGCHR